ncbi:MAG TPA: phospho-N-acetylmuramoyl-pentapeptide-transferase, partial [Caldisericia bacterium]|nr:phospho-N-acetylmuramoyl-pentapeptide-transferase [Caldisericia bacterium]
KGVRIFKMSPIHHHFELSGWKEIKVVVVFWVASAVFGLLMLGLFYLLY